MRAYPTLRSLHLYAGLFVSPFVVVFSLSVFFLVHSWLPGGKPATSTRSATEVVFPADLETAKGREQIDALRIVLERLGLRPLLDLDLRLGEGTGAALAMSLFSASAAMRDGMATFEEAAVSERL